MSAFRLEHDWHGLVSVVAPNGLVLGTRAKIAVCRPGSGIPVDALSRPVVERLQGLCDRLNGALKEIRGG